MDKRKWFEYTLCGCVFFLIFKNIQIHVDRVLEASPLLDWTCKLLSVNHQYSVIWDSHTLSDWNLFWNPLKNEQLQNQKLRCQIKYFQFQSRECRKLHFRESDFKNFPGKHAPGPPALKLVPPAHSLHKQFWQRSRLFIAWNFPELTQVSLLAVYQNSTFVVQVHQLNLFIQYF